jgi:hypothetical protein
MTDTIAGYDTAATMPKGNIVSPEAQLAELRRIP